MALSIIETNELVTLKAISRGKTPLRKKVIRFLLIEFEYKENVIMNLIACSIKTIYFCRYYHSIVNPNSDSTGNVLSVRFEQPFREFRTIRGVDTLIHVSCNRKKYHEIRF